MKRITFMIGLNEDTNIPSVLKVIGTVYLGFNATQNIGYWEGKEKRSLSVVVLAAQYDANINRDLARRLANLLGQEEVWYTVDDTDVVKVHGGAMKPNIAHRYTPPRLDDFLDPTFQPQSPDDMVADMATMTHTDRLNASNDTGECCYV